MKKGPTYSRQATVRIHGRGVNNLYREVSWRMSRVNIDECGHDDIGMLVIRMRHEIRHDHRVH